MVKEYTRDQILECLMQGWSLSKKPIKGHPYGYLQKYREPSIYLGKWTPVYAELLKLQNEDYNNGEDHSIDPTESPPPITPPEAIQVEPPRALSAYTKGNGSDKIPSCQAIEVPELKIFPTGYTPPQHKITPDITLKSSSPLPLPEESLSLPPILSISGPKEEAFGKVEESKESPKENNAPWIVGGLLLTPSIIGGIGFVIHNWEAIDKWGKDRLKDITDWWRKAFP